MKGAWIQNFQYVDAVQNPNISHKSLGLRLVDGMRISDIHFTLGCLEPGEEIAHSHAGAELFFILHGCGETVWEDLGRMVHGELRPGSALYVLPGTYHLIRNTGMELLEGLLFHASPHKRGGGITPGYEFRLLPEALEVDV